jgi:hypothetical protein
MKVLDLRCAHAHPFEGWFASEEDYLSQREGGLVECPLCGDKAVTRLPSAPRLNVSKAREPQAEQAPAADKAGGDASIGVTMHAAWLRAVQHVISNTDDVGDRFPEEARRIHYGETGERAIRGQATPDEAQALREEGIEVVALPMPAALKGPIQ